VRTLQVKDNPTTLARALTELGRIIKSVHVLRYIDDAAFRRRMLTQLNRQELRRRLGRRIFLGVRGEIQYVRIGRHCKFESSPSAVTRRPLST